MSRRERIRQITLDEIKSIARQQMRANGTAAISLSAIAREMGISQPAIYRYYASRDDLITALIVDAYNDLADSLEAAPQSLPMEQYALRLSRVLHAYRNWALAHPVDFSLIYGNPIPSYHAPREATLPPAQRGFGVILQILSQAHSAGALKSQTTTRTLPAGLSVHLPGIDQGSTFPVEPEILYIGLVGWYHIHGMIMLELFEHNTALISDMDLFYQHEVAVLLESSGFSSGP